MLLAAGFLLPTLLATASSASCSSFLAPLGVLGPRCRRAKDASMWEAPARGLLQAKHHLVWLLQQAAV